jgi:ATP-binding cassette, subfamily B, multidrug efflux pump
MTENSFLALDEQDEEIIHRNALKDFESFFYLVRYTKGLKGQFFIGCLLIFLASTIGAFSAKYMGAFVEFGAIPKNKEESITYAILIIVIEIVSLSLIWGGRKVLAKNATLSLLNIRAHLFSHLQKIPLSYLDKQPQGRIITRLTHDVEGVEEFFTNSLGRILTALLTALMSIVFILLTNVKVGLILVCMIIPAILFISLSKNQVRKVNRDMSKRSGQLNSLLSEFINGLEVIRSGGLEEWSQEEFNKSNTGLLQGQLSANFFFAWSRPLVAFLATLPLIALLWFGGNEVISGVMTVGMFVTLIRYVERFYSPIFILAREYHIIQQAFTNIERVASFLKVDDESSCLGTDGTIDKKEGFHGKIEFKNLWMKYDKEWILQDINFCIRPGEKIGLIGRTGSGKTTTVTLLARLYPFQRGDILIDDVSITKYKRSYLRKHIGYVTQDVTLFSGSLRHNLTTDESLTDEDIISASETTGLGAVLKKSQRDLNLQIINNGENLSVGEKQLISLTRILLNNPSILIMDEATSNIDREMEIIIQKAVEKIMKGRTCLFIAHRLETLSNVDKKLIFNKGHCEESK